MPSLLGLAPGGVYRAAAVTGDAVRSYRTLSPLRGRSQRGLLSVALSLRRRSPRAPPGVTRHRYSAEPGLSSRACAPAAARPSGGGRVSAVWPVQQAEPVRPTPPPDLPNRVFLWEVGWGRGPGRSAQRDGESQPLRPWRVSAPLSPPVRSERRIARHWPSITPSIRLGRKRLWKARTAASPSTTS